MELGGRMSKYWLPWLVGMPGETAQAVCCMIFGGVLERFPKLKVCFAHGGTYCRRLSVSGWGVQIFVTLIKRVYRE